ncbi:hypothetical protein GCM10010873_25600 [Cypionkella aquatica]|uniref:Lipoprotein n=1 Tax=Cypionkella aquatica TaxID=1756042 RepID=A0AA37U339_9RHOB|nr:hypothetical protein [Cypionkella aquatica]GLS87586.1 hypothetical protein GCM10010873_25600 [Cypionkella aquatica]
MPLRLVSLVAVLALSACGSSSDMQLYPTAGPFSQQTPPPVIHATAETSDGTSGALSFRLPDRTKCSGTWSALAPKVVSRSRGLSLSLRGPGGNVGNKTESVGGINPGEIYAVCKDGTVVQGKFMMGSSTTSGTGTATDTRGNTYKLLF